MQKEQKRSRSKDIKSKRKISSSKSIEEMRHKHTRLHISKAIIIKKNNNNCVTKHFSYVIESRSAW